MDLTQLHEDLSAAHAEALAHADTHIEGLDAAACGPHLKHLAQLAVAAAAAGASAAEWRQALRDRAGVPVDDAADAAEACMRQSGLWPWHP